MTYLIPFQQSEYIPLQIPAVVILVIRKLIVSVVHLLPKIILMCKILTLDVLLPIVILVLHSSSSANDSNNVQDIASGRRTVVNAIEETIKTFQKYTGLRILYLVDDGVEYIMNPLLLQSLKQ